MTSQVRNLILSGLMIASSIIAFAIHPTEKLANKGPGINLESMIPKHFGNWQLDEAAPPIQVSPDVQHQLDELYSQLLSRTYVDNNGQRIMLSISYGGNQGNDEFQVHRPEYCYVGQGFDVQKISEGFLNLMAGKIQVRRLLAQQGPRVEPITYWITVGDEATLPGIGRKIVQLKYGLTGRIPDGMLVRVSSISGDRDDAYRLHDVFINELINSLSPSEKIKLIGKS